MRRPRKPEPLLVKVPGAVPAAPMAELDADDLQAESLRCVVVGFFDTGMYEFDSRFLYLHLDDARNFFGYEGRGAGLIGVRVDDMMMAAAIGDSLEARLGGDYRAVDWMALNSTIFRWVKLEKVLMFFLVGLIVLPTRASVGAAKTPGWHGMPARCAVSRATATHRSA